MSNEVFYCLLALDKFTSMHWPVPKSSPYQITFYKMRHTQKAHTLMPIMHTLETVVWMGNHQQNTLMTKIMSFSIRKSTKMQSVAGMPTNHTMKRPKGSLILIQIHSSSRMIWKLIMTARCGFCLTECQYSFSRNWTQNNITTAFWSVTPLK